MLATPLHSDFQATVVFKGLHVFHRRFAFAIARYMRRLLLQGEGGGGGGGRHSVQKGVGHII